jgi:fluoride exporter
MKMLKNSLLVGFGAFFGANARFWVGQYCPQNVTLIVINLSGSFAMGVLGATTPSENPWRYILGAGFLGGFTTYSAFSLQIFEQLKKGENTTALLNFSLQSIGSILFCAAGYLLINRIR